jgi:hypothetical protein
MAVNDTLEKRDRSLAHEMVKRAGVYPENDKQPRPNVMLQDNHLQHRSAAASAGTQGIDSRYACHICNTCNRCTGVRPAKSSRPRLKCSDRRTASVSLITWRSGASTVPVVSAGQFAHKPTSDCRRKLLIPCLGFHWKRRIKKSCLWARPLSCAYAFPGWRTCRRDQNRSPLRAMPP